MITWKLRFVKRELNLNGKRLPAYKNLGNEMNCHKRFEKNGSS